MKTAGVAAVTGTVLNGALAALIVSSPRWEKLKPYQFHGSLYGVAAAKRGHLKPVGQWNSQAVICKGHDLAVALNDTKILDVNLDEVDKPDIHGGLPHTGLKRNKGHIGFLGHGGLVEFRSIRIKELASTSP